MTSNPPEAVADIAGETAGRHLPDDGRSLDAPDTLENAVLAHLEPEGISNIGGWQQRKSARTRIAILEAAMKCLAEKGYGRTTTKTVASMANVSRGAMLHHYPTKKDLIEQVIAYTFFKRMERNFRGIRQLTERERLDEMSGVTLYWKNLNTLEYRASLELCVAARSNEELRKILAPKAAEFEDVLRSELPKVYSAWTGIPAQLKLADDVVTAALDGLLINQVRWRDPDRAEKVRRLLGKIVGLLRTGAIRAEDLR